MGAAQVLLIPTVPLKHPDFDDWSDMPIPINYHWGVCLNRKAELENLRYDLAKRFEWTHFSAKEWDAATRRLRAALKRRTA